MTLAELKTYIQNTVRSSETSFVAMLDTLIRNAEKRIHNRVMMPDAKATASLGTTIDGTSEYEVASANVLVPLRVYTSDSHVLVRKSVALLRELGNGSASGKPEFYAWVSSSATVATVKLWPSPLSGYELSMDYIRGVPPTLVSAATWLSTNYPDVLRKVAVHEASIYLKQGEMGTQYGQEAEKEIQVLAQVVGAPQRDEFWA